MYSVVDLNGMTQIHCICLHFKHTLCHLVTQSFHLHLLDIFSVPVTSSFDFSTIGADLKRKKLVRIPFHGAVTARPSILLWSCLYLSIDFIGCFKLVTRCRSPDSAFGLLLGDPVMLIMTSQGFPVQKGLGGMQRRCNLLVTGI